MSAIEDRITAVLRKHGDGPFINADCTGAGCECGWSGVEDESWFAHVAAAVVAELQLTQEWAIRSGKNLARVDMSEENAKAKAAKYPESFKAVSRMVTGWEKAE